MLGLQLNYVGKWDHWGRFLSMTEQIFNQIDKTLHI